MRINRLALVVLAGWCAVAMAVEVPVPVPWALQFDHIAPKRVTVQDPVDGKIPFWYITYAVTNPYADPKAFAPEIEIVTKDGKRYQDNVFPAAQKLAETREGRTFLNCIDIAGTLKPGEAKQGIAVFKQIDPDTNYFSVFVRGISAVKILEIKGDAAKVRVKVFQADYYCAGDRFHFDPEQFKLVDTKWVTRDQDLKLEAPIKE